MNHKTLFENRVLAQNPNCRIWGVEEVKPVDSVCGMAPNLRLRCHVGGTLGHSVLFPQPVSGWPSAWVLLPLWG